MPRTFAFTLILMILLPFSARAVQLGEPAPGFSLVGLDGNVVSLEQFKGKVVFLDFWAPWCVPCRDELPELDKLYKKYKQDGFEVIGISVENSDPGIRNFLRKVAVTFPVLVDKQGKADQAYGFTGLPAGFLISREGVIRYRHMGFGKEDLAEYEQNIIKLLKK
jgi:peroxiredoxin